MARRQSNPDPLQSVLFLNAADRRAAELRAAAGRLAAPPLAEARRRQARGRAASETRRAELARARFDAERAGRTQGTLGITANIATPTAQTAEFSPNLNRWRLQKAMRDTLTGGQWTRARACCHARRAGSKGVTIWRSADGRRTWPNGVQTCGSVWCCPICSARIAAARRREVNDAADAWEKRGGGLYMVSYTMPHYAGQTPAFLVERHARLWRRFKTGKGYKLIVAAAGIAGTVRALEVTHGRNGWHVHTHELIFTARPLTDAERDELTARLTARWLRLLAAAGVDGAIEKYAVRLTVGDVEDYVCKWGAAAELAEAVEKRATDGGASPWQLLARVAAGDTAAAALFVAYAAAFKGRRQLFWSPGFRQSLNLAPELTDAAASESEPEENPELLGELTPVDWARVRRALPAFLECCRVDGLPAAVARFAPPIPPAPPPSPPPRPLIFALAAAFGN